MDRPKVDMSASVTQPAPVVATISSLTASRDAATVQRVIRERYGFEPSLRYCADLVNFVEALTDGQ